MLPKTRGLYLTSIDNEHFMWLRHFDGSEWSTTFDPRDAASIKAPARLARREPDEHTVYFLPQRVTLRAGVMGWPRHSVSPFDTPVPVSACLATGQELEGFSDTIDWSQVTAFKAYDRRNAPWLQQAA